MAKAILEEDEKKRFLEWLNIQIDTSRGMAEQMEKMFGLTSPLTKQERLRLAGFEIVARYIMEGESFTVG